MSVNLQTGVWPWRLSWRDEAWAWWASAWAPEEECQQQGSSEHTQGADCGHHDLRSHTHVAEQGLWNRTAPPRMGVCWNRHLQHRHLKQRPFSLFNCSHLLWKGAQQIKCSFKVMGWGCNSGMPSTIPQNYMKVYIKYSRKHGSSDWGASLAMF
jgi:hypothetical protein